METPVAVRRATAVATVVPRSAGAWWRSTWPAGRRPAPHPPVGTGRRRTGPRRAPPGGEHGGAACPGRARRAGLGGGGGRRGGRLLGPLEPEDLHRPPPTLTDPEVRRAGSGAPASRSCGSPPGWPCRPPSPAGRGGPSSPRTPRRRPGCCATVGRHGRGRAHRRQRPGARASDLLMFRALDLHVTLGVNVAFPVLPLHGARSVPAVSPRPASTSSTTSWPPSRRWPTSAGSFPGCGPRATSRSASTGCRSAATPRACWSPSSRGSTWPWSASPCSACRRCWPGTCAGAAAGSPPAWPTSSPPTRSAPSTAWSARWPDRLAPPSRGATSSARLGDRVTTPRHTLELWHHWGRPAIRWYPGGHVGHLWSTEARSFVHDAVRTLDGRGGKST